MASLKDRVVELTYSLKDKFSKQVGKVTSSIRAVDKEADKSAGRIEKSTGRISNSFLSMGNIIKGAVVGLVGRAFISAATSSINLADQIQKLSIRLGISTEALSELRFAADRSGISFNTLTMGLQRMTRRISEAAKGTGEAKDAIKELGLDSVALAKLAPEDQLAAIADAFLQIGNSGDRVRLAMRLFDSEGVAFLQLIENGAAGLREMREEAKRAGATLTDELAEGAAKAKDALATLNASYEGISQDLTLALAEPGANILDYLSGVLKDMNAANEVMAAYFDGKTDISFFEALTVDGKTARNILEEIAFNARRAEVAAKGFADEFKSVGKQSQLGKELADAVGLAAKNAGEAETNFSRYIDKLKEAVKESDRLKESNQDFLSEINDILNPPQEATFSTIAADLSNANKAIKGGDLEGATRIYDSLKESIKEIAKTGEQIPADVASWARSIGDLGNQIANLSKLDEELAFAKAEEEWASAIDTLETKIDALNNKTITINLRINDDALKAYEGLKGLPDWIGQDNPLQDLINASSKTGT